MSIDKNPTRKRKTLGRGLSALFGEASAGELKPTKESGHQFVPIEEIMPGPGQPRRLFQKKDLESLAESIKNKGVLQPLLLRRSNQKQHMFEIVAGERRWRAAQLAQIHEVPAIIDDYDDKEIVEIGLIENIQRADLSPIEEAEAFAKLMEVHGYTQDQVAQGVGKSRSHIANTLRLLLLPMSVKTKIENNELSAGHARALLTSQNPERLAEVVLREGLSVRATEKLAKTDLNISDHKDQDRGLSPANRKKRLDPDILSAQNQLEESLGLKVIVNVKGEKGEMIIKYETLEQFDYIFEKLQS